MDLHGTNRQHSLLQHQATSEEKHGRQVVETAGPFSAVSLKQLTAPEERQGRLQDPSLQCQ